MRNAKRALDKRRSKKAGDLYASILPGTLAAATRMSGAAVKLLLLAHAAWRPNAKRGERGRVVLPYAEVARRGGEGLTHPRDIAGAFGELCDLRLIALAQEAVLPGRAGGAKPRAAEWFLPERDGEPPAMQPPPGWRRPQGKVRIHVERVRRDVRNLSSLEIRVFALALSVWNRDHGGGVTDTEPVALSGRQVAEMGGCSHASAARALAALVETRRLIEVEPARGRSPARYRLGAAYLAREQRLKAIPEIQNATSLRETQTRLAASTDETQAVCVSPEEDHEETMGVGTAPPAAKARVGGWLK